MLFAQRLACEQGVVLAAQTAGIQTLARDAGTSSAQGKRSSQGVSRQTLHAVLAERSGVSAEMALRLGTLLGNGAQLWLDMQTKFDLWQAEAKLHDELGQMRPLELLAIT